MDRTMHEERELGELLVLMVGAHRSFQTLRASARMWHHTERSHEAFTRENTRIGGGSLVSIAMTGEDAAPTPVEMDDRVELWLARPDRLREETVSTWSGEPVESLLVQVGDTWWWFDPSAGAMTNGSSPNHQHGGRLNRVMLDPADLVASRELEIAGRTQHAGRPAIHVLSRPRIRDQFLPDPGGFGGAWEQDLLVDAERGILLRLVNLLDGEPFAIVEFLEIEFDEEIADELFVFVSPPGEEVRDARDGMRVDLGPIPLHEAAGRVPFPVFVPAEVPAEWRLRAYVSDEDERRRWPTALHIHYSNEIGTLNVNVNEQDAGDGGLPATAPDGSAWRVEHLESGELLVWEPTEAERGMPRVAMLELAGTRIRISTDDLDAEAIAKLAASLIPAPTDPPGV
jgi:outer membrane lipoprotein-sorting protein